MSSRAKISILFLLLSGCASVNSVSLTPIPEKRNNIITSEVSKTIFLAFNFNNDFVDQIVTDLKSKCPHGTVSGILTKDEVIWYFLFHTRKVTATGFCENSNDQKVKL